MARFSATVMEHASEPRNGGPLAGANARGQASLSGRAPRMVVELRIEADTVLEGAFQTFGCGVSVACGSMLTELVMGQSLESCRALTAETLLGALGGLPADKRFCAELAVAALHSAVASWDGEHGKASQTNQS